MNKDRRKALDKLQDQFKAKGAELNAFMEDWHGDVTILREELESLKDEEQDYFDNMPEGLQAGERGQAAEAAVSALDEALSELDEKLGEYEDAAQDEDPLSGVFDHIEEAKGAS